MRTFLKIFILFFVIALSQPCFAAEKTDEATAVKIKPSIIKYRNFYRVVFEAQDGNYVNFTPYIDGNILMIDFDRPNNINTNKLTKDFKEIVKSAGSGQNNKSIILKLKVSDIKLRKFITDNATGFDLFYKSNDVTKIARNVIKRSKPLEEQEVKAGENPNEIASKDGNSPARPVFFSNTAILTYPLQYIGPPAISHLVTYSPDFIGPPRFDPTKVSVFEIEKDYDDGVLTVQKERLENGIKIAFPFGDSNNIGAVVFRRDQNLYIVFDTPKNAIIDTIKDPKYFNEFEQIKNDNFSIFKLKITKQGEAEQKANLHPIFYKNINGWNLEILEEGENFKSDHKINGINISAENFWGENRIIANKVNANKELIFKDETTGETLRFIPLVEDSSGVANKREFVDFRLPTTLQGLVIEEKSDFISSKLETDRVIITKTPNLILSEDLFTQDIIDIQNAEATAKKKLGVYPEDTIFPFKEAFEAQAAKIKAKEEEEKKVAEAAAAAAAKKEAEANGETLKEEEPKEEAEIETETITPTEEKKEDFVAIRQEFFNKLTQADQAEKTNIRLEIAKFYFTHSQYHEAVGMLTEIKTLDPKYENIQEVSLLLAASSYLKRDYDVAAELFTSLVNELQNSQNINELYVWLRASNINNEIKNRVRFEDSFDVDYVSAFEKFMKQYPKDLRYSMTLGALEYKIKNNKIDEAKNLLDIITISEIPDNFKNDVKYYEAVLAEQSKDFEKATKLYDELIEQVSDRKNRARAIYNLTKHKLIHNLINIDEAIEGFNKASVIWRDDYFELDSLKLAGQLYLSKGMYYDCLLAWKALVSTFPDTADSIFILGRMKEVFSQLYDEGKAYEMKPLEALKIYFKFKELMPIGEAGDRITKKVADYFVKSDLVDDAITVLNHQIKFRAQGNARDELIIYLGNLYLDNKMTEKLQNVLDLIDTSKATKEIIDQMKYLKARAFILDGNFEEALAAIKDDFSPGAQDVRIEYFWAKQNWFGVMDIIEKKLPLIKETAPFPLKPKELNYIAKLAVAYGAQEEFQKMEDIKKDFRERIPTQKDQILFDYLTNKNVKIDYERFSETTQLSQIEEFMNKYNYLPLQDWPNVITVLEPRVEKLKEIKFDDLSKDNLLDIVRLGLAYSLIKTDDPKVKEEYLKKLNTLAKNFKDVRVERFTIEAFSVLDDKVAPIENDAVFDGKVRLTDIPALAEIYKSSHKISELNTSIRGKF
jgi:hypothetical protein